MAEERVPGSLCVPVPDCWHLGFNVHSVQPCLHPPSAPPAQGWEQESTQQGLGAFLAQINWVPSPAQCWITLTAWQTQRGTEGGLKISVLCPEGIWMSLLIISSRLSIAFKPVVRWSTWNKGLWCLQAPGTAMDKMHTDIHRHPLWSSASRTKCWLALLILDFRPKPQLMLLMPRDIDWQQLWAPFHTHPPHTGMDSCIPDSNLWMFPNRFWFVLKRSQCHKLLNVF